VTARVKYSGDHAHMGVHLGGLRWIQEHTGMDKVSYMDVRFEHGLVQMTSEDLGVLVRCGQEQLAKLLPRNGSSQPNCSGALADLGEEL
jgi:hypothetical protein